MKWVRVVCRDLECVNFVSVNRHSWGLVGEIIKGCIALCSINMFVIAFFNNLDDLVVVGLL